MQGLQKLLLLHVLTCLGQHGHGNQIIHGEKVPENLMLYMVSLQNNNGHVCGGFLISEKFVLTAASCDDKKPEIVVLGSHNLNEFERHLYIERIYKPKTFVSVESRNDIMLLELSRKVQLDNKIQKIRLPEHGINVKENQQCQVAGWGKTATDGKFVDELRMVDVSVIKLEICKEKWPGLPADVICAGGYGTNKGFCQGDFGGPLVCNGTAFGVASFNNMKCDYPDVPNVYTDITKHLDWINDIIKLAKH
ncbi:duodenase-1-like [Anabas testudineus]|uniref:Peptidase S1 domain-containing protein n=1 Tax=Anabas testudineus TaxID=64144 RepID=A0AAQ6IMK7_ANATE|nr:duodenase-1-like [Anabas testudineus]